MSIFYDKNMKMYIKFLPNEYVIRYSSGRVVNEGLGLSFFFLEHNTSAVVIPMSNNDIDFIFEEITADFQVVTVQGQLTYKIKDAKKIAETMDFTVNLKNKKHNSNPMQKLSKRIINISEVLVKSKIGSIMLTDAIQSSQSLAESVYSELKENNELIDFGVQVSGFSILKISANIETARALEAKTREEILKQADDALYERRNASIEQERKVKENQLNTDLSIEQKKKTIKESEIATKKMVLEKENELSRMKAESENQIKRIQLENDRMKAESEKAIKRIQLENDRMKAESENEIKLIQLENEVILERKRKELAELHFENSRKDAEAEAYRISSIMDAYTKLSPEVIVALSNMNMAPEKLIAQAFQQLAVNSQKIGQLNITPDLLESVMNKRN